MESRGRQLGFLPGNGLAAYRDGDPSQVVKCTIAAWAAPQKICARHSPRPASMGTRPHSSWGTETEGG